MHFYYILENTVALFCLCPKDLRKPKFKTCGLTCSVGKISVTEFGLSITLTSSFNSTEGEIEINRQAERDRRYKQRDRVRQRIIHHVPIGM